MLTRALALTSLLAWGLVAGILAGCGGYTETQWMKVNQSYTTEEFRRDHKACSKGIVLDEACMRDKGWVDVQPSARDRAAEKPAPTPAPQDYKFRR
jgi:hypothetical protein